jgi:osmotically-inducible protein OsmY
MMMAAYKSETFATLAPPTDLIAADTRELARRIVACLRDRAPDVEGIDVTVTGNTAEVRGRLHSPHEKWLCLECCRHVPGVMHVVDELVIAGSD